MPSPLAACPVIVMNTMAVTVMHGGDDDDDDSEEE